MVAACKLVQFYGIIAVHSVLVTVNYNLAVDLENESACHIIREICPDVIVMVRTQICVFINCERIIIVVKIEIFLDWQVVAAVLIFNKNSMCSKT